MRDDSSEQYVILMEAVELGDSIVDGNWSTQRVTTTDQSKADDGNHNRVYRLPTSISANSGFTSRRRSL